MNLVKQNKIWRKPDWGFAWCFYSSKWCGGYRCFMEKNTWEFCDFLCLVIVLYPFRNLHIMSPNSTSDKFNKEHNVHHNHPDFHSHFFSHITMCRFPSLFCEACQKFLQLLHTLHVNDLSWSSAIFDDLLL